MKVAKEVRRWLTEWSHLEDHQSAPLLMRDARVWAQRVLVFDDIDRRCGGAIDRESQPKRDDSGDES